MTTRRSFMASAASLLCGSIVLPAWVGWLDEASVDPRSVLLLTDRPNARLQGLDTSTAVEHRPLSLDIAADIAHVEGAGLEAGDHSALVAFGTPVSVFALRTQLNNRWRVVVHGMHCVNGPSLHQFNAPTVMAPSLSRALAQARNEDDFTRDLIGLGGESVDLSSQEMISQLHHARHWAGSPRASLLALRRRVA